MRSRVVFRLLVAAVFLSRASAMAMRLTARIGWDGKSAPCCMNLDTYESATVEGLFVTLPSTERANLDVVDELAGLALHATRRDYELSGDAAEASFSRFVMTEILRKGYATHGADGLPLPARRHWVR